MIGGLITLILWWVVGGFDWGFDFYDSYRYDKIATECEFYFLHGMDFENYDAWLHTVAQTWEFNKQVGVIGGPLEWVAPSVYEDMKYKYITYNQEEGMFNFFSVYF